MSSNKKERGIEMKNIFDLVRQNKVDELSQLLKANPETAREKDILRDTPANWAKVKGYADCYRLLKKYERNVEDAYVRFS